MSYYQLHPDIGMNFQMNRVLTYGEEAGRLEEVRSIAAKIHDFESWYTEWRDLAQKAEREGRYLHAAYGYRMAEFFLTEDRPEKMQSYQAFIKCFYQAVGQDNFERVEVPYEGKSLPAMRLQAPKEKAIIVVHGGYDSFMEEFYLTVRQFPQMGYTIILFEGPGQGAALKRGLKLTYEWEKPVAAILDYFDLRGIALLGISWGGYLALRAAAFEPRIERVVAYDVCFDGLEVMTRPMPTPLRQLFKLLVRMNAQRTGNMLVSRSEKEHAARLGRCAWNVYHRHENATGFLQASLAAYHASHFAPGKARCVAVGWREGSLYPTRPLVPAKAGSGECPFCNFSLVYRERRRRTALSGR